MRWRAIILTGLFCAGIAAGCEKSPGSKSGVVDQNYPALPPPAKVDHPATISGRVLFEGKPPQLPPLNTSGDPHCQRLHPDGLPDESVVVADDGAMANVFVYLKDGPRSDGSANAPALIDQIGCQYVPHAVAVQVNQTLRIKSSDPVMHNVHLLANVNPAANLSETGPGEQTIKFAAPEMIHVRCDVHPWMKAIVGVFDSPYFAVTGSDGKFEIRNIPPGTYTLAAWQERLGEKTQKVTVAADGFVTAELKWEK
jgi:plastocyanin